VICGARTSRIPSIAKCENKYQTKETKEEQCALFVCLFGGVSEAGEIRTLPKTSLLNFAILGNFLQFVVDQRLSLRRLDWNLGFLPEIHDGGGRPSFVWG
jgi:hypothetical protein